MDNYKYLKVFYNDKLVGTLAKTPDRLVAFEYDSEWLATGFSISPFSLPLLKKVFLPKFEPFEGLFGVFNDSLPDGWGRLLVDRLLLKNKINPNEIARNLADKIKEHRKKLKISQEVLAQKSGVSLGSIKRFETKYEISLQSFIKIAIALDLDNEFENLFTQKTYNSINEIINGGVNG